MNARVKQQGGWAESFVMVGILLALLLVGGVYFLKSNQVQDGDIAVDTSTDEKTTNEKNEKDSTSDRSNENEERSSEESRLPKGGREVADEEAYENLPATGPTETIASSLILALITFSSVAYVRSRARTTL